MRLRGMTTRAASTIAALERGLPHGTALEEPEARAVRNAMLMTSALTGNPPGWPPRVNKLCWMIVLLWQVRVRHSEGYRSYRLYVGEESLAAARERANELCQCLRMNDASTCPLPSKITFHHLWQGCGKAFSSHRPSETVILPLILADDREYDIE